MSTESMLEFVALSAADFASERFAHLLWLAVEVDGDALRGIVAAELPLLTIVGVRDAGEVVGFLAWRAGESGADGRAVIEYLATAEDTPSPPDPRWPERPRYDCVLAPGLGLVLV